MVDGIHFDQLFLSFLLPGERPSPMETQFCQALRQLSNITSSQLCVKLAAGGDPMYSFNVRLTGEEVHGTSKSHSKGRLPKKMGLSGS